MTTENKGLVERLESHMGLQDVPVLLHDCREAAARIRELEAEVSDQHQIIYVLRNDLQAAEARCRKLEAEVEKLTKEASAADAGFDEAIRQERVWRVDAEARCRKLEEALREIRGTPAEQTEGVGGATSSYGVGYAFHIVQCIAIRALLDQADGEEG